MKMMITSLLAGVCFALAGAALGQTTSTNTTSRVVGKPAVSDGELEARFKATLTNATFAGRWYTVRDGQLGAEREDKYTIQGASRLGNDRWVIYARVQYGQRDLVAPVPVQVKWAGDAAVIIVDNLAMPGGTNRYSARVMVYDQTYAGTWSAGDHGGLLSGLITRKE
jgi:hypothetical protein